MKFNDKLGTEIENLGGVLVELLPENWDKVYLLGRVEDFDDSISYEADYYVKINDKIEIKNERVGNKILEERFGEIIEILKDIYNCFKEYEQEAFTEMIFILDHNYKLKLNFLYDKIEEDNYLDERFQNWKKELELGKKEYKAIMRELIGE